MDRQLIVSAIVSFLLFVVMMAAFSSAGWFYIGKTVVDTALIAKQMFEPSAYGITLLVVAVLLGASMIGGVYLAKEE